MTSARGLILVADDEPQDLQLVTRLMTSAGYDVVTSNNGAQALATVREREPEVVILDVNMPEKSGFEVCRAIKDDPRLWLTPVILVTGLSEVEDRVRGLDAGADDFLSKPFACAELMARVGALVRARSHMDGLESADSIVLSLGQTIEARDAQTAGHCERLARYASALGQHVGLDSSQCDILYKGGYLHDIGKVGIPDAILLKEGALTSAEHAIMQRHTIIGDTLCAEFRSLGAVRPIVRHHHERLDGSGYPDRLKGNRIPLLAQITSVVDGFDAMTNARPYRTAQSREVAFAELRREAEKGWKDSALVESFIAMMAQQSSPASGAAPFQPSMCISRPFAVVRRSPRQ